MSGTHSNVGPGFFCVRYLFWAKMSSFNEDIIGWGFFIAKENMMAEKKIRKLHISQVMENKLLRKIVEITNSELGLEKVLKETVNIITEVTKADSVFIYLLDNTKKQLSLMASKTPHQKEIGQLNLKAGEGIAGWVFSNSSLVAIAENAYKDERFKSFDVLPEDKYEALLSVPIINKGKAVGVVNIQNKRKHDYSEKTIDLISLIVKQIEGVLENARLYEEAKKKAVQFDNLMKVSNSITSKNYLEEILSLIVVVTAEILSSKICSIMLVDKTGKELEIKATQSLSEHYRTKPNLKIGSCISGDVIRSKKPIAIFDVREEKRYSFRGLAIKEKLTSMLCVPMVVKEQAIGLINVYTEKKHEFTKEEIDVLQMVANQAAVVVENTKLVEESIKAKEALETRKIIEKAKGLLMQIRSLNEDDAYKMILKKSMDSRKSMKEVSESILLMSEFKSEGVNLQ